MSKQIILFYSLEGAVKEVSEYLSKELNIPFEEIKPVKDINKKRSSKYFKGGQQVKDLETPELLPMEVNLDEYDSVFLGSPIWSGSFAPAIRTILENGILTGKKVAFFYAHEGAPGNADKLIEKKVNRNNELVSMFELVKIDDGIESVKNDVLTWAKGINSLGL